MLWIEFIKDRFKKIDKGILVFQICVLIIFFIVIDINQSRLDDKERDRKQHIRYTIGITTGDVHYNPKSSLKTIDFIYTYRGTKYDHYGLVGWLDKSVLTGGGRYYVEFSSLNPENSEILFDRPVPSHILNPPYTGWASIP